MRRMGLQAVVLTILAATFALAHSGATGVVKERMVGMKAMSDATKALGAMKADAIPFSVETMHLAADEIARHGAAAQDLFPEGSLKKPSEALPVLWDEKAEFNAILERMVDAADQLKQVSTLDQAEPLMTRIGDQCKDCHSRYRIKK